jgi:hypothetical protein
VFAPSHGCDGGNTSARLFGSTLAFHSIEFLGGKNCGALQQELEESAKSGDGVHFGSEQGKKRNVGAKNEIELVWRLADRTCPVLVC